jgi:hypothetical protein
MLGKKGAAQEARAYLEEVVLADEKANYFGVESEGKARVRGNCALMLGTDKLVSVMWLPRRALTIPTTAFRAVEEVRSHMGRSVAFKLIKLQFVNDGGLDDSVAWFVSDREAWVTRLREICERNQS